MTPEETGTVRESQSDAAPDPGPREEGKILEVNILFKLVNKKTKMEING